MALAIVQHTNSVPAKATPQAHRKLRESLKLGGTIFGLVLTLGNMHLKRASRKLGSSQGAHSGENPGVASLTQGESIPWGFGS